MSHMRHARVSEILADALDLTADERRSYLDRACGGDPKLRAEVESLLEHDRRGAPILDHDVTGPRPVPVPDRIGPFYVLEKLGEGGMGVVYRAEQRLPIQRQVAIKRIRAGFATQQVLARFELERRTLAVLDHPNVARVIDAASTDDGLPYFAMEYVRGTSITRYCDEHRLEVAARLRLFLDVCEGVEHAHRHGIIHRDLKPSNLLVTEIEGRPIPKIIDFGVAKALEDDSDRSALTMTGQLVGTPRYMSPEQAAGSQAVDTRADVYSLGAVLYELLVGCPPPQVDASPPSVRVAQLGEIEPEVARARISTPKQLTTALRGDLDWIVMKTLEAEPDRRYGSIAEFASDLRRHLAHEPVTARPPTFSYRSRKWIRRHRTAAALIATLVPLGLFFTAVLILQANRAEEDRYDRLVSVVTDLFNTVPDAVSQRFGDQSEGAALIQTVGKIERGIDDPVVQARLYSVFARTLRSTREYDTAETAATRARDGLIRALGPEHRDTLAAQVELGRVYAWRWQYEAAERELTSVLDAQRRTLGDRHPDTVETVFELAQTLKLAKRHAESARLFEELVDAWSESLGHNHARTLIAKGLLASEYLELRRLDEAETLLERILPLLRSAHSNYLGASIYNLACVRALQGDRERAMEGLREVYDRDLLRIGYGMDPNMAPLYGDPEFQEMVKRIHAMHPSRRWILHWRAMEHAREGRYAKAEALLLALKRDTWGAIDPSEWDPEAALAESVYMLQRRYDEAKPILERTLERRRRENGPADLAHLISLIALARSGTGDAAGALTAIDEAVRVSGEADSYLGEIGPEAWFYRAVRSSILGDDAEALHSLQQAYDRGYWYGDVIELEIGFDGLRGNPEFEHLRDALRARIEYP